MPQKRKETVERIQADKVAPDLYESWLNKQVKARLGSPRDQIEEDDIDNAEDAHEKAHRRKRGKGSAASNP
jgi:hypothetical protein